MLNITELINELVEIKGETKVHCAIGRINKLEPLRIFSEGKFKQWQEDQNNKNFERKYILSLIYMKESEWLFAGIFQSVSVDELENGRYSYKTILTPLKSDLIGKLIVYFEKDFRNSYLLLENHINSLFLCEIKKESYSLEPFPGYEKVLIDFNLLQTIIQKQEPSWYSSLSNVKGVYVITDNSNGKHYIGSAYGDLSFWQRWKEYSINGHGGNTKLKQLIAEHGLEYANNFIFSIIEIRSMLEDNETIIERETFWKNVFLTKEFGYNEN